MKILVTAWQISKAEEASRNVYVTRNAKETRKIKGVNENISNSKVEKQRLWW